MGPPDTLCWRASPENGHFDLVDKVFPDVGLRPVAQDALVVSLLPVVQTDEGLKRLVSTFRIEKGFYVIDRVKEIHVEINLREVNSERLFELDHKHHHVKRTEPAADKNRFPIGNFSCVAIFVQQSFDQLTQIVFFVQIHLIDSKETGKKGKMFAESVRMRPGIKGVQAYDKKPDNKE